MRFSPTLLLTLLLCSIAFTQNPTTRNQPGIGAGTPIRSQSSLGQGDPEAVALVATAIHQMGAAVPQDSVASGTVHLVAGSREEDGTIRILTKGVTHSREEITVPSGVHNFIYADGMASENLNGAKKEISGELGAGGPSPIFPLTFLTAASASQDFAASTLGGEEIHGARASHLKVWRTHGKSPKDQYLVPFSEREVWLDQNTGLPWKVHYLRRTGFGAVPAVSIEYEFSDYRDVNGFKYPFSITKSVNGVPWATITINSVVFNTGLTTNDFPMEKGR